MDAVRALGRWGAVRAFGRWGVAMLMRTSESEESGRQDVATLTGSGESYEH